MAVKIPINTSSIILVDKNFQARYIRIIRGIISVNGEWVRSDTLVIYHTFIWNIFN